MSKPLAREDELEAAGFAAFRLLSTCAALDLAAVNFRDEKEPHLSEEEALPLSDPKFAMSWFIDLEAAGEADSHSPETATLKAAIRTLNSLLRDYYRCLTKLRCDHLREPFRLATPTPAAIDGKVSLSYFEASFWYADDRLSPFADAKVIPDRSQRLRSREFEVLRRPRDGSAIEFDNQLSEALLQYAKKFQLTWQKVAGQSDLPRYEITKETQRVIGRIPSWHFDDLFDCDDAATRRWRLPTEVSIEKVGEEYELVVDGRPTRVGRKAGIAFKAIYEAQGKPVGLTPLIGDHPKRAFKKCPDWVMQHLASSQKGYSWIEHPHDSKGVQP